MIIEEVDSPATGTRTNGRGALSHKKSIISATSGPKSNNKSISKSVKSGGLKVPSKKEPAETKKLETHKSEDSLMIVK